MSGVQGWRLWSCLTGLFTIGLLQCVAASGLDDPAVTASGDDEVVALGKELYPMFCARCHGHGLKTTGTSTYDLRTFPVEERARFITSVTKGKNGMPPHASVLSAEEIEALYAYVASER